MFSDAAGQGPTLIVVRSTKGFTCGGYAAAAWNNSNACIPAAGSFVFWVQNPQGLAPGCLDCVNPAEALYGGGGGSNGPVFDSGMCVHLCYDDNSAISAFKPSPAYPDTTGLGDALFTGAGNCTVEDYEVWAAT